MSPIKKTFLISSILLFVVLFFGGIYFFAFQKSAPTAMDENPASIQKDVSPTSAQTTSAITSASSESVLAPILMDDDLAIEYYSKYDGRVYKTDPDGNAKKIISDKTLVGLSDILWSPDKKAVLSKFQNNGTARFSYYNYATRTGASLNGNISNAAWQNNSKILYVFPDSVKKNATLNISDPDGKNWKRVASLESSNTSLAPIPRSGLVSFWNKPDAFSETKLSSVSILGGEPQILFSGRFGADYLWSQDGNYILASSSDKKGGAKMSLGLLNGQGKNYKELDIPTIISKCVWSKDNKTIFYALPGAIPDAAVMPNDYLEGKIKTTDTFWKINIATGEKTRLVDLDKIKSQMDATGLFLNSNESLLFFINRLDDKLYKINL